VEPKTTQSDGAYLKNLTVFLYNSRCFLGLWPDSHGTEELMKRGINVLDAIELRIQMGGDPRQPVMQVAPSPVVPANKPITMWLPPCAHFSVEDHKDFIDIYRAMTGRSGLVLPAPGVAYR
jgi:hypothetical protein